MMNSNLMLQKNVSKTTDSKRRRLLLMMQISEKHLIIQLMSQMMSVDHPVSHAPNQSTEKYFQQ